MRRIRHNEIGKNLELSLLNHCINIYVETIGDKTLNIFGKPKSLWKLKSLWLLQNAILTKDNLTRRNWKGSEIYAFYTEKESEHLFVQWMTAKYIWILIAVPLESVANLVILISFGFGSSFVYRMVNRYMQWRWQLFVKQYGAQDMFVLRTKEPNLPLRLSIWRAAFLIIGQDCKRQTWKGKWSKERRVEGNGALLPQESHGGRRPRWPATHHSWRWVIVFCSCPIFQPACWWQCPWPVSEKV